MHKADNLPPSCAVVTKSGNLNFLEPSGLLWACNGTALPFTFLSEYVIERTLVSENPHVALKVDNNTLRNDAKSNTVSETKVSNIDSKQKDNKHNPVRYCTSTKELVEEPKKKKGN